MWVYDLFQVQLTEAGVLDMLYNMQDTQFE